MKRDKQKDAYEAAFNEAASELRNIFGEVERLSARRDHVAKLVDVLNNRFGFHAQVEADPLTWKSQYDGLRVATRMTVIQTSAGIDED